MATAVQKANAKRDSHAVLAGEKRVVLHSTKLNIKQRAALGQARVDLTNQVKAHINAALRKPAKGEIKPALVVYANKEESRHFVYIRYENGDSHMVQIDYAKQSFTMYADDGQVTVTSELDQMLALVKAL